MAGTPPSEPILRPADIRAIRRRLPLFVAVGCLMLTMMVSQQLQEAFVKSNRDLADAKAEGIVRDLESRLTAYEVMLRSAASFISNDPNFDGASFDSFVSGSDLLTIYPGLRAIGYAEWVPAGDEPQVIVRYIHPRRTSNLQVVGRNLMTDPTRGRAIQDAVRHAVPTATAPIRLIQDRLEGLDEPGFLVLAPVFDTPIPPGEQARAEHIRGFVYMTCRGSELVQSVFNGQAPLSFIARDRGEPVFRTVRAPKSVRSMRLASRWMTFGGRRWEFEMGLPSNDWSLDPTPFVWWVGVVVSMFLGGLVAVEVRGRSKAEAVSAQLELSERALHQSDERYRLFLANSSDGIWRLEIQQPMPCSLDPDSQLDWIYEHGRVGECNEAFSRMCGHRSAADLVDRPVREVLDHESDWIRVLLVAFVHAGYRIARFESEQRLGDSVEVRLHSLVGDVREGSLYRAWGVVRSITAERLAQRRVEVLNEELESRVEERTMELTEANQELESFAYSISHDLRTPLRAMAGFSQILEEDYGSKLDEDGRGHLQRIRAAAVKLAGLIDALLSFSRLARSELKLETVDLSAIARRVCVDLQSLGGFDLAEVVIQEGMTARADPLLMEVLVQNLLSNAFKFSANAASPRVEFSSQEVGGKATFIVADNGVGFDEEYSHRLFRPFERLHRESEFPGTGIGLATVHRIVQRHGGEISMQGAVGEGATVRITLG